MKMFGKENGDMKKKIIEVGKYLVDRVKFFFELRAYDKAKRNEEWLIDRAFKEQQEIDSMLKTNYADDLLTNKKREEE